MSDKKRRMKKWIGYPLFAIFIFFVFLYLSLPYDKLKRQIESYVSAIGGIEVSIEDLGPRPLLGVAAQGVLIKIKPKEHPVSLNGTSSSSANSAAAKAKPIRIILDKVVIKSGLLALLSGGTDVSFAVMGLGGEMTGSFTTNAKKGWELQGEISKINLSQVPYLSDTLGLPLKGSFSNKIDLTVPENRWSKASGTLEIECEECTIGDGKALLKVPGNPLLAIGITLPKLRLGRFGGQIKVTKGVATFENFSAHSPDIEAALEGTFNLRDPVSYSEANAYLRFKVSAELKKRDPRFELLENGLQTAKRADGFFGVQILGLLKGLRYIPSSKGPTRMSAQTRAPMLLGSSR